MRNFVLIICTLLLLCNCKNQPVKDVEEVDKLLLITDSLLIKIQDINNLSSEKLYSIPEDSTLVDSLIKVIHLPDSIGFFQYLEQSIVSFNDIISETTQEVYFVIDQLSSLKNERLENTVTESEYSEEITEMNDVIEFLKARVDSNMMFIQKEYSPLFISLGDSITE